MKFIPPSTAVNTALMASDSLMLRNTPPSDDAPNERAETFIPVFPISLYSIRRYLWPLPPPSPVGREPECERLVVYKLFIYSLLIRMRLPAPSLRGRAGGEAFLFDCKVTNILR